MARLIISEQEIKSIKKMYGLLKEETTDEIRKILEDAFPCMSFLTKGFEKNGDIITQKTFSKKKNGNFIITYKVSDNFFVSEVLDGPDKGLKRKFSCNGDEVKEEVIQKSELFKEYEQKVEKFPCIKSFSDFLYRKNSDNKLIVGISSPDQYAIWFNLDDSTYFVKGGNEDGEKGKFSCNGDNIKWGDVDTEGTRKNVTSRMTPNNFQDVTAEEPIIYGMRDNVVDNGLISLIQGKLKELELYPDEPDGQFGPKTLKAVKSFQSSHNDADGNPLVVDGKVGPKTIEALGLMD